MALLDVRKLQITDNLGILSELDKKWSEVENNTNVFRYKLNVLKEKTLPGKFKFFVQLNTDRTTKRRPPEEIQSITPAFDRNKFNFTKICNEELLFEIEMNDKTLISILVNNSPLTKYHCLMCPNLIGQHSQILNKSSILFAIHFLKNIYYNINNNNDNFDKYNFKIGYNSPGAMASVNHLHLHLIYLKESLYTETAKLNNLKNNLYLLDDSCLPINGFCFIINKFDNDDKILEISNEMCKLIEYLCEQNIPHNVLWTSGSSSSSNSNISNDSCSDDLIITSNQLLEKLIKIIIFPRHKMSITKKFSTYNVAFCELSGYISVGINNVYDSLDEDGIKEKISKDMGNVTMNIKNDVVKRLYDE